MVKDKAKDKKGPPGPKPLTYGFFLFLARLLFKLLYAIRFERDPRISRGTGPYFMVANHIAYVDPIICALAFPHQRIRFVSGQEVANTPFLRPLLKRFGIIEIKPFRVNFSTTKEIITSIAAGHSVALYPETQRSMAGDITPFGLATAKLIRHLKAPVALALCRGGYLGWPRWSKLLRPGKMEVETRLLLTAEEAAALPVEEIQGRLVRALDVDDYSWQTERRRPARFFSRRRAEKVSSVCHWCPVCDQPFVLRSHKQVLYCSACDLRLRMDAAGFFAASPGSPAPFDHPLQLATWQRKRLAEYMESGQTLTSSCRLSFLENVGKGPDPEEKELTGSLCLQSDGLIFQAEGDGRIIRLEIGQTPSLYCSPGAYVNLAEEEVIWRAYPEEEGYVALLTDFSRQVWLRDNPFQEYRRDPEAQGRS